MSEEDFWALVAETREGGESLPRERQPGEQNHRYRERLSAMSPEALVGFHRAFEERMREADTKDLWAAAYMICGGCSDDGFRDFRAWLIAQGREVFKGAVPNPDSLADHPSLGREYPSYPAFWSIPQEIYNLKTGGDFPDLELPSLEKPTGIKFEDDEDALRASCPRLYAAYCENA